MIFCYKIINFITIVYLNMSSDISSLNSLQKSDLHLILDMDQTLIDTDEKYNIFPRPYLKDFLNFCFEYFQSVSIWTVASKEWFNEVNAKILYPWKFKFVWCGRHTIKQPNYNSSFTATINNSDNPIKNLKKIWRSFKDMTRENTFIVDDTESTFSKNPGNGIIIPKFKYTNIDDNYLNKLREFFIINNGKKLRYMDKTNWYQ